MLKINYSLVDKITLTFNYNTLKLSLCQISRGTEKRFEISSFIIMVGLWRFSLGWDKRNWDIDFQHYKKNFAFRYFLIQSI